MPPLKRRKLNRSRKKKTKSLSQQSQNVDTDREWAAREILAESSAEYLIDWEPNSDTGEKYSPTWEPKRNASKSLIKSWKQDKLSRNSFTTDFSSVTSLNIAVPQPNNLLSEDSSSSTSSRHNTYKQGRQKRQVEHRGPKSKLRKLSTHRKRKHICSSTEGSDSGTIKAVDLTTQSPDSECIQGSALVNFGCTSTSPSADVKVSEGGLTGSYFQPSGREFSLASQLIATNSTCFIESSASSSAEPGSQDNRLTLSANKQPNLRNSITLARHLNFVPSYSLDETIDEIPESWEDQHSRKLITDPLNLEACAAKPSEGKARETGHNSVVEEQILSEGTLLSTYARSDHSQSVRCSLDSYIINQSIVGSPLPLNNRLSQPAQNFISSQQLATQSYDELDSSNVSNAAAQEIISSTTSDEILNISPISLNEEINEELRSSVSRNELTPVSNGCEADAAASIECNSNTPIATTLNPQRKDLAQNSSFQVDNNTLQRDRQNFSHQTRFASLYSQNESFQSTFETLSALASSYVTPEPGNQTSPSQSACGRLSPSLVTEVPQGRQSSSTSTSSYNYLQSQISSTFGGKPNVLVLAPTLLSEFQSNAPSSDSEDISTPFRTQISVSEHSLHTTKRTLTDFKCNEKTKVWEQYILEKFGLGTSDGSSHHQDRILKLLEVLSRFEEVSHWKADALILFFIAINSHLQKSCTRGINSLAGELFKTALGDIRNISSDENKDIAAKPLFVERDTFKKLIQKHNVPLTVDGEYQITLDNPALQQSGQVMGESMALNVEMKDKGTLSTTHDRIMQSSTESVGDYEVADVVASTSLTEPLLEEEEYILPLPMQGTTAQQYKDIIPYYDTNIKRFTSKKRQKARLELRPVKRLLEHLNNITYHVDLENDRAFTQEHVSKSIQAKWDETCSSKFRVLGAIFDDLKDKNIHIVVTLRSGKPVAILENWLKSKKILFFNASRGEETADANMRTAKCLFVSIITDEASSVSNNVSNIDAIFALDCSFTVNRRRIKELQAKTNNPSRLAPIVSFIIYASQEHILRCIPASLNEIEYLQVLVSYVSSWRLNAGKLPSEVREIIDCTSLVSDWVLARAEQVRAQNSELDAMDWPMPLIDKTDSGITAENLRLASSSKNVHHSLKRSNDQVDDVEYSKRMRTSSQFLSNQNNDVSITHISETNLASSQQNRNVDQQVSLCSRKSSQLHTSGDTKIILLKEQLLLAQEKVKDLESTSEDIQKRCDKQRSDIEKLQEENKQLRSTCEHEKKSSMELAEAVDDAFVETQDLLEQENQSKPQCTKIETTNYLGIELELKELREERDKLESKVKKQDKELDFIRERYREASDAAMKSTQQATSFENALQDAQRQASGEAARLKQMHYSNYTSRLEDENRSLKAVNENLTDLLRRKDDELRALRARTMLSTRATSVPHSPRFGPTGSGSRAGSPPTPKHHPLRTLG